MTRGFWLLGRVGVSTYLAVSNVVGVSSWNELAARAFLG
jgi:hypothetical protein